MILVTTAGKAGSEAVLLLRQRQVPVRVLVRTPDKATALAEAGAEIAAGDLDAPASIDAAMAGITTVVLVSPGAPAQELAVIGSAARAGAGHVIKVTSNASADSPIARRRWQAEIEAGLAASGLAHTLLRSNAYMQNVLALAPAIAKTSGFGSSAGKGRAGMTDARDVAAVAAEIAASPAAHAGKTYWLTGPELISNSDVAAVLSKLLGRRITYRELSFEDDKEAMIRAGVPAPIAEMNAQAFSMIADRDAEWVTEDVPSLAGRRRVLSSSSPPTTPPHSRKKRHFGTAPSGQRPIPAGPSLPCGHRCPWQAVTRASLCPAAHDHARTQCTHFAESDSRSAAPAMRVAVHRSARLCAAVAHRAPSHSGIPNGGSRARRQPAPDTKRGHRASWL